VSEANKTAMRQFFERVYNQGDVAFLDELTAPEFVSHDRGNPTNDRAGVKQIVVAIKTAFPDVAFTADDVISEGDRVAARFTMRGTQTGEFMGVPPTNLPIVVTGIDIVRFEGRKAVEHWHEWSGMELLQQLGVLGSH
jgi:predicted ester cyclase